MPYGYRKKMPISKSKFQQCFQICRRPNSRFKVEFLLKKIEKSLEKSDLFHKFVKHEF